jgi:hypothetical protein
MSSQIQADFDRLMAGLRELLSPYAGKVEYGNLRAQTSEWDTGEGGRITNIAIVYETPGGSTDQINVSFDHSSGCFSVLDDNGAELETIASDDVLRCIRPRIFGIPDKRLSHLCDEIKRQMDTGMPPAGVIGHLNRLMNSELRGGTITHLEMRDAMTFAVQYARGSLPAGR